MKIICSDRFYEISSDQYSWNNECGQQIDTIIFPYGLYVPLQPISPLGCTVVLMKNNISKLYTPLE